MKPYRCFLFDLDGTLTDSGEGVLRCVQYALDSFGIHVEDWHSLRAFMGPPLLDSFRDYYGFSPEQARQAITKYRERYNDVGIWENRVYEGIPGLLEQLRDAGGRLFVATSKPEVMARRVLERFELTPYFEEIVGSELDGTRDQKAEVLEEVFRRGGFTEEDRLHTVLIGDRLHDIRGAKTVGIDCLGSYHGYAAPGELEREGATLVAHSVEEIFLLLMK